MFIEKMTIEGYKNFGKPFAIEFRKGLNVLVGENAVGKTAIIDAIRSILLDDDYERKPISDTDFYLPFGKDKDRASNFRIECYFGELSQTQQVAFLPWTNLEGRAKLTLLVENKQNSKGRYKRLIWGGSSRASMFERELFDKIDCIYLPPLRDAEAKLREGKSSRLARLLKNVSEEAYGKGVKDPIVDKVEEFNKDIASDETYSIAKANHLIRGRLVDAIGEVFGQNTHIKFTEANFGRIVESLRLFFFPEANATISKDAFRSLEENSLGYNNLLYLATVLAELTEVKDEISFRTLLIEEPEAHLHPQLQTRLLKYLEKAATKHNVQVIVTTHSPVLASAASIDSLIHLSRQRIGQEYGYKAVPLRSCGLPDKSKLFVSRWLDVTKSTLLFARGVILVEGIAEAMLVPVLAPRVLQEYNTAHGDKKLPATLEDAGVSVISMNGIYFEHFMQLFCNLASTKGEDIEDIPVLCSGITDRDPAKKAKPTPNSPAKGMNHALGLEAAINTSTHARLFSCALKTFEYDLGMQDGNLKPMLDALHYIMSTKGIETQSKRDWQQESDWTTKASAAYKVLRWIESPNVGKGLFAHVLSERVADKTASIAVPEYIKKAVIWACGGDPSVA